MNKKIVISVFVGSVLAVLFVVGGYFGYGSYQQHKFVKSITPNVKNVSLRLTNAIRYETVKGTKITFGEYFSKLESDISEIDKHILEIQTLATPRNKNVTEPVLTYLRSSQELLRALVRMTRAHMNFNIALDNVSKAERERKYSNYYNYQFLKQAADSAISEMGKAIKEIDESNLDVIKISKATKEARTKVGSIISSDALTETTIFDALIKIIEDWNKQSV